MLKGIQELEAELRDAGHDVERDYLFEHQASRDGAGWVVRVDGELVAAGASLESSRTLLTGGWRKHSRPPRTAQTMGT